MTLTVNIFVNYGGNELKLVSFDRVFIVLISKEESWCSDIFGDESKFNISGSDRRHMVWRNSITALNLNNLRATSKHGGGNVMV